MGALAHPSKYRSRKSGAQVERAKFGKPWSIEMIDLGVFFIALPVKTRLITACTVRAIALEPIGE